MAAHQGQTGYDGRGHTQQQSRRSTYSHDESGVQMRERESGREQSVCERVRGTEERGIKEKDVRWSLYSSRKQRNPALVPPYPSPISLPSFPGSLGQAWVQQERSRGLREVQFGPHSPYEPGARPHKTGIYTQLPTNFCTALRTLHKVQVCTEKRWVWAMDTIYMQHNQHFLFLLAQLYVCIMKSEMFVWSNIYRTRSWTWRLSSRVTW